MKIVEFGEPLLRQPANEVSLAKIKTAKFQKLVGGMREFLIAKKLGVGLAAPQIGQALSLAVVLVQPTKNRLDAAKFELVIINPKIIKTIGNKKQLWEGCISGGPGKGSLFAKVPRYKIIELSYLDEKGKTQTKILEGLPAQIIQHEVDHLNGVLFVDRVKDTKSYTTYSQYLKMIKAKRTSSR